LHFLSPQKICLFPGYIWKRGLKIRISKDSNVLLFKMLHFFSDQSNPDYVMEDIVKNISTKIGLKISGCGD